jgi:hypothetical protein
MSALGFKIVTEPQQLKLIIAAMSDELREAP